MVLLPSVFFGFLFTKITIVIHHKLPLTYLQPRPSQIHPSLIPSGFNTPVSENTYTLYSSTFHLYIPIYIYTHITMKLKTKTWLKPLCEPLYDLVQFSPKNMSFYNTIVPSPIATFLLRLIALISRLSFAILEIFLDLNFRFSNLSPSNIALDDKTVMHFWAPTKIKPSRPNVVLIHGYGGTSRYQFYWQVGVFSGSVWYFN